MHFNAHVTSRYIVKSRCQTGEASRCKNCNIAQPYWPHKKIFNNRNVSKALRWTRKDFGICIPLCLCGDSNRRNNSFHLKFQTNIYVLCVISCIVFSIHCLEKKKITIFNVCSLLIDCQSISWQLIHPLKRDFFFKLNNYQVQYLRYT